jgi:hypothetical protein
MARSSSSNEPRLQWGDTETVDSSGGSLLVEPGEVLLPGDEVVHLLDVDASEEAALRFVLRAALLHARRPDLRGNGGPFAACAEGRAERFLRASVHRRRVEDKDFGIECGVDDRSSKPSVAIERPIRPQPDHWPEASLLHRVTLAHRWSDSGCRQEVPCTRQASGS